MRLRSHILGRPQASALSHAPLALLCWAVLLAACLAGCVTAGLHRGTVTDTWTDKQGIPHTTVTTRNDAEYMDNRTGAALAGGLFGGILDNLGPGGVLGVLGAGGGLLGMLGHLLGQNKGYAQAQVESAGLKPVAVLPPPPAPAVAAPVSST